MSEFWENSCWSCPSFYSYISLDKCACMRVCSYVQALISAFCLVCIPILHYFWECCWNRRKLMICKSFKSIVLLKAAHRQTIRRWHYYVILAFGFAQQYTHLSSLIPQTLSVCETRILNNLPRGYCYIWKMWFASVELWVFFFPPKHTLCFSAWKPAFIIEYYEIVGYPWCHIH